MKWEPWGKYARRNGNHSICKVLVNGVWSYELWRIEPQQFISRHASFQQAQAEAEND